ncbi:SPOR domain-containing protein [Caloranaerobacter ferrireducens]|uniref:SPOR domain-containing protein n=1 Tax=Caloranaerobacter ferrireducens TaxID=1323370 RepID=UPI00084D1DB2|nr:SPOR domain-containing protein [Caloranaerobacter ferrireducens]
MRSSRRKRKSKKDKLLTIFVFFIIAPVISIAIGILIVQSIIMPHFEDVNDTNLTSKIEDDLSNNESNENIVKDIDKQEINDLKKLELTIEGFDLYNIQLGSFSNVENAKALRKELREKGVDGYIVKISDYKVFYATFLNREICDEVLTSIRESYKDAFVNKITVDDFVIKYDSNEQETADMINEIIKTFKNAFDEETALWHYALVKKDLQEILKTIRENNDQISKLLNNIDKDIENPDFNDVLDNIRMQVKEREQILQSLINNKQNIQDSYDKYYKMLFDFIKIFK